jgi:PAS domain S-box-containing protein
MNQLERYRQLIGFSPDGVHELDVQGRVVRMNDSGCAALCIADPVTAIGQPLAAFWPELARTALETALATAREGRSLQFTQILPSASGEEGWWLVSVHPYLDAQQQVDGIAVISQDITEQVQARLALDTVIHG